MLADEYAKRGMSPREARDAALRSFGNVEAVKMRYREQASFWMLDAFVEDVRFAIRVLLRDRAFAVTAVLVLGLGIGVNNMLFTMVYSHTMRGLPVEQPQRVLHVSTIDQRGQERGLSYPEFDDLRREVRNFVGVAAFSNLPVTIGDEGRAADRFMGTYLSAGAFELVGTRPALGRAFVSDDDRQGAARVVILGGEAWKTRYSSDPAILGRTILLNGNPTTVIGVMPEPSRFPSTAQVWQPISLSPTLSTADRNARALRVFGRVRDGVPLHEARAEIEVVLERASTEHSLTNPGMRARVVPINDGYGGRLTDPAWLAFTAVSFLVVIISCSNVANLMLARTVQRARELAIRVSLGASRGRIAGQLLVESVVLALLGGTLGLGISLAGIRVVRTIIPKNAMPYWFDYALDSRVFGVLVVVSLGAVLLFGFVPALQASRANVNQVLKAGGRAGNSSRSTERWTTGFLAAQFALTVILLSYVVIDVRTSPPPLRSDTALDTPDLVTASITLPPDKYPTPADRVAFYRLARERIGLLPGVKAVSIASQLPLTGAVEKRLELAGQARSAGDTPPSVWTTAIDVDYFRALGLAMTRGREFSAQDGSSEQASAVVNQRFADMFFANDDPIGSRIRLLSTTDSEPNAPWLTIVGVSESVRQRGQSTPEPVVYLPLGAVAPQTAAFLLRTGGDLSALTSLLRDEVRAIDPGLPLYRLLTMPRVIDEADWVRLMSSSIVRFLTLVAVGLAVVGLYAVTSHAVAQRRQEIGVRIALGAQPRQVGRLILVRALRHVVLGLAGGVLCTMLWDAAFFSGRVDVRFAAPGVLGPVTLLLALITLAACVVPLRRATGLDPVAALRQE